MSFGENLKNVRKQRGITQEELAETLGVSRQAISKWESDNGYPETEKLLLLSKKLNISLDYLMNDASEMQEKEETEEKNVVIAPSGKIAITTHDKQNVIVCHSVICCLDYWCIYMSFSYQKVLFYLRNQSQPKKYRDSWW